MRRFATARSRACLSRKVGIRIQSLLSKTDETTSTSDKGKPLDAETKDEEKAWDDDYDDLLKVDVENKTISTAVGPLPISPLMDPLWQEARARFKDHKPEAEAKTKFKCRFRRTLARNPYAQMLATPFRLCVITSYGLPRYFLQDFNLLRHPETRDPWFVPMSLGPPKQKAPPAKHDEADAPPPEGGQDAPSSGAGAGAGATVHEGGAAASDGSVAPTLHALARRDLLLSVGRQGKKPGWHRLLGAPGIDRRTSAAVYRKDMDVLVLSLMRERAFEALVYLAGLSESDHRGYFVRVESPQEAKVHSQRACFVWFGDGEVAQGQHQPVPEEVVQDSEEVAQDQDSLENEEAAQDRDSSGAEEAIEENEEVEGEEVEDEKDVQDQDPPEQEEAIEESEEFSQHQDSSGGEEARKENEGLEDEEVAQDQDPSEQEETIEQNDDTTTKGKPDALDGAEAGASNPPWPGQFATARVEGVPRNGILPVHNLPALLGTEMANRLRSESTVFREGSLFLVRGMRTIDLQMRLWKLQGYLADYRKVPEPSHFLETSQQSTRFLSGESPSSPGSQ